MSMKKQIFEIAVITSIIILVISNYHLSTTGKVVNTAVSVTEEQISISGISGSYRKIVFENNYVKVSFLPEIGGRIYEFIDKSTGHNQFYKNPVYQRTNWGLNNCRTNGGWIALGGMEFALPDQEHGITYDSSWAYSRRQEGENAVIEMTKDNIDTACSSGSSRIKATVRITLGPNDRFFTLYTKVENTGSGNARFQYWIGTLVAPGGSNDAKSGNIKIDYTSSRMQIHSTNINGMPSERQEITWPSYNGKDYSNYDSWKNDGWLGIFTVSTPNSVSVYSQNSGEGVRRTLLSGSPAGIKFFAPGNIPSSTYTNDNSNYVEMWTGLTKTFWDYITLSSGSSVEWTEKWEMLGSTVPPPVPPPSPSSSERSKLGLHTNFRNNDAWDIIQNAKPAVVKIFNGEYNKAADIKAVSPCTFVLARIFGNIYEESQTGDPEQRAQEWFNRNRGIIQSYPSVDCWEGYNEPNGQGAERMRWMGNFERKRIELLNTIGAKACIGSFSVGNPTVLDSWREFYPALRAAQQYGGYLALHEYGSPNNMRCLFDNSRGEGWLNGRYRKVYREYLIPDGVAIPLIITEAGIDGGTCDKCSCNMCSGENSCGWKAYGVSSENYMNGLGWYDSLLKEDGYVIGATIYQTGILGWQSFETAPELTQPLKNYINQVPAPTPPNCPVPIVSSPRTGSISGRVTDRDSGNSIQGAAVTISGRSATTGADGSYRIENVPVGTYTASASASGYISADIQDVVVSSGQTTPNINFELEPVPPAEACSDDCGYIDSSGNNDRICINHASSGDRYVCSTNAGYGTIKNACDWFDALCFQNSYFSTWSECDALGDGSEKSGSNGITDPKGTRHNVNGNDIICMPVNNYYESWVQCGGSLQGDGVLMQQGETITDGTTTYYCCNNRWQDADCSIAVTVCGDGSCDASENSITCPQDCPVCRACGESCLSTGYSIGICSPSLQCITVKPYVDNRRCCIDKDCQLDRVCLQGECTTYTCQSLVGRFQLDTNRDGQPDGGDGPWEQNLRIMLGEKANIGMIDTSSFSYPSATLEVTGPGFAQPFTANPANFQPPAAGTYTLSATSGSCTVQATLAVETSASSASTCSDNTPVNTCSSTKPKYCDSNGNLVDNYCYGPDRVAGNTDDCGCSSGTCQSNGNCRLCNPGEVRSGTTCLVCNAQGTGYSQDSNRCPAEQACQSDGSCSSIKPDIDVTYIERTPKYDYDATKNSPDVGDTVRFIAHIRNNGNTPSGEFSYKWYIDGNQVRTGIHQSIGSSESATETYDWIWENGEHRIKFAADEGNSVSETSEINNEIEDRTNALAVGLWVERSIYNWFNANQIRLGIGSTSWEDWAQRQMSWWNDKFARSTYPDVPNGVMDRVRIDKITVVNDGALPLYGGLPTNNPDTRDRTVDLMWGFPSSSLSTNFYREANGEPKLQLENSNPFYLEPSLPHELSHARYITDTYAWNFDGSSNIIEVLKQDGTRLLSPGSSKMYTCTNGDIGCCNGGLMGCYPPSGREHLYSEAEVFALNRIAGQRATCGNQNSPCNLGEYLLEFPLQNYLHVTGSANQPVAGARVDIYQSVAGTGSGYSKFIDNTVDITCTTDANGVCSIDTNPFGIASSDSMHAVEMKGVAIVKITVGSQEFFRWFYLSEANMAYAKGDRTSHTYETRV